MVLYGYGPRKVILWAVTAYRHLDFYKNTTFTHNKLEG